MDNFLVIGLEGSSELLIIDVAAGTVTRAPESALGADLLALRQGGTSLIRGVDVAIAASSRADAVGRYFFENV